MRISFHGADQDVTGSCHLVECGGRRVLVDCGMFQGERELDEENGGPFGFDPADIDIALLTHAHLDHCGRLPLLVKQGFRGEIVTTAASRELARLVLIDAAHLHEEDARRRAHQAPRGAGDAGRPLFTLHDAFHSLDAFGRAAVYGRPLDLLAGIRVTFLDAGHILGSASLLLELEEQGRRRRVLFSGDIGNAGRPLLADPVPAEADVVVMETTYGDRRHRSIADSVEELYGVLTETLGRGGNVIIPTFALERAQELLYFFREAQEGGRLPRPLRVFLDSPMAISATEIFERHPEGYNDRMRALFRSGSDPFGPVGLEFVRDRTDSEAVRNVVGGAVIMAGSGMCTGGRVRRHLRDNLGRAQASVLFVGYAGRGTLARLIIDGAPHVRLFGDDIPVRARVHTIGGFSAHADQAELTDWHGRTRAELTMLVHGEDEAMKAMASRIGHGRVLMPKLNETVDL